MMNRDEAREIARTICEEVMKRSQVEIDRLLENREERVVQSSNGGEYTIVIEAMDESTDRSLIHVVVLVDAGTLKSAMSPVSWDDWIKR